MDDYLLWILVCIGIPLFGIIIFLWGFRSERKKRTETKNSAAAAYQQALDNLKALPGDPNAQQEVLRTGKAYVAVAQFDKNDPFTESRLLDELNAAQPGVPPLTSLDEASAEDEDPDGIGQQLQDLEKLRSRGLISEDDYHARRLALFDQL